MNITVFKQENVVLFIKNIVHVVYMYVCIIYEFRFVSRSKLSLR